MTPIVLVALSVAGGVGAATRLFLDGIVRSRTSGRFPLGTAVINISGSLALGLLAGLTASHLLPEPLHLVLGTGFLGGYTTFSTASFETVRLLQAGRYAAAVANGFGILALAGGAAAAGYLLGAAF